MALVTDSMGGGHPEFDRNQRIYAPRTLTADGPFLYDKRNKHGKNHTHIIPYLDLSMFIYMILFIFSNHPKKTNSTSPSPWVLSQNWLPARWFFTAPLRVTSHGLSDTRPPPNFHCLSCFIIIFLTSVCLGNKTCLWW